MAKNSYNIKTLVDEFKTLQANKRIQELQRNFPYGFTLNYLIPENHMSHDDDKNDAFFTEQEIAVLEANKKKFKQERQPEQKNQNRIAQKNYQEKQQYNYQQYNKQAEIQKNPPQQQQQLQQQQQQPVTMNFRGKRKSDSDKQISYPEKKYQKLMPFKNSGLADEQPNSQCWFYKSNNQNLGPFNTYYMDQQFNNGALNEETKIAFSDTNKFVRLKKLMAMFNNNGSQEVESDSTPQNQQSTQNQNNFSGKNSENFNSQGKFNHRFSNDQEPPNLKPYDSQNYSQNFDKKSQLQSEQNNMEEEDKQEKSSKFQVPVYYSDKHEDSIWGKTSKNSVEETWTSDKPNKKIVPNFTKSQDPTPVNNPQQQQNKPNFKSQEDFEAWQAQTQQQKKNDESTSEQEVQNEENTTTEIIDEEVTEQDKQFIPTFSNQNENEIWGQKQKGEGLQHDKGSWNQETKQLDEEQNQTKTFQGQTTKESQNIEQQQNKYKDKEVSSQNEDSLKNKLPLDKSQSDNLSNKNIEPIQEKSKSQAENVKQEKQESKENEEKTEQKEKNQKKKKKKNEQKEKEPVKEKTPEKVEVVNSEDEEAEQINDFPSLMSKSKKGQNARLSKQKNKNKQEKLIKDNPNQQSEEIDDQWNQVYKDPQEAKIAQQKREEKKQQEMKEQEQKAREDLAIKEKEQQEEKERNRLLEKQIQEAEELKKQQELDSRKKASSAVVDNTESFPSLAIDQQKNNWLDQLQQNSRKNKAKKVNNKYQSANDDQYDDFPTNDNQQFEAWGSNDDFPQMDGKKSNKVVGTKKGKKGAVLNMYSGGFI